MYVSGVQKGDSVIIWERDKQGRRIEKTYPAPYYFYIETKDSDAAEYTSIYNTMLERLDFQTGYEFHSARSQCQSRGIKLFESDINPVIKVLSENYHEADIPSLNICLLDIEVDYREKMWKPTHLVKVRAKTKKTLAVFDLSCKWIEITCQELRDLQDSDLYQVWDEQKSLWVEVRHSDYVYVGPVGFSSVENPYAPINAVAIYNMWEQASYVLAVPPPGWDASTFDQSLHKLAKIIFCKDERELLDRMLHLMYDADVISGWNSAKFDIPYIAKRLEMYGKEMFNRLSFPNAKPPQYREFVDNYGKPCTTVDISGRIHLDYMELFKKYEMSQRSSYSLENIAAEILPKLPKLDYTGTLARLYRDDFNWFIRYNIRDTEILVGFEERLAYIALANVMAHTSCALFTDILGTLKLTDYAIVNYCHYVKNVKVPDWVEREDGSIKGAYVLVPQVGMHDWIGSVDINSLYPSAIRSINISPETLLGKFINTVDDWEKFYCRADAELTVEWETGECETRTTLEWRKFFADNKMSVSGFGVIFSQKEQGVVPAILERWYAQRKQYQKQKTMYIEQAKALLVPYK